MAKQTLINTYKIINTTDLTIRGCAAHRAVNYNAIGEDRGKWWLPSKDELDLLYKNLYKEKNRESIGWCWSSSVNGTGEYAWKKHFNTSTCKVYYKSASLNVIAVHAF